MRAADDEQCVRRAASSPVADGQTEPGFQVIATIYRHTAGQSADVAFLKVVLRGEQFQQKLPQRFAATELVVAVVFIAEQ